MRPDVSLVPVAPEHVHKLLRMRRTPAVAARWGAPEPDWPFDDPETVRFAVLVGGGRIGGQLGGHGAAAAAQVGGFIQYSEETDPMYRHAGIDIFLDPAMSGRGVGRTAVWRLARTLIDERGHHRLSIDPAADNTAAIRCYASVGFRPVGFLRQYERGPDGTWHDALLMDLLAHELREP